MFIILDSRSKGPGSSPGQGHGVVFLGKTLLLLLQCLSPQGPKLRPAGRQCKCKLSVGDQNFKASRQQATNF